MSRPPTAAHARDLSGAASKQQLPARRYPWQLSSSSSTPFLAPSGSKQAHVMPQSKPCLHVCSSPCLPELQLATEPKASTRQPNLHGAAVLVSSLPTALAQGLTGSHQASSLAVVQVRLGCCSKLGSTLQHARRHDERIRLSSHYIRGDWSLTCPCFTAAGYIKSTEDHQALHPGQPTSPRALTISATTTASCHVKLSGVCPPGCSSTCKSKNLLQPHLQAWPSHASSCQPWQPKASPCRVPSKGFQTLDHLPFWHYPFSYLSPTPVSSSPLLKLCATSQACVNPCCQAAVPASTCVTYTAPRAAFTRPRQHGPSTQALPNCCLQASKAMPCYNFTASNTKPASPGSSLCLCFLQQYATHKVRCTGFIQTQQQSLCLCIPTVDFDGLRLHPVACMPCGLLLLMIAAGSSST